MSELFLPGVPEHLVRQALDRAGGNELASGKFANPESSAALAANGFGWFIERPALLPAFPGLDDIDWPAVSVEIERQMEATLAVVEVRLLLRTIKKGPFAEQEEFGEHDPASSTGKPAPAPAVA